MFSNHVVPNAPPLRFVKSRLGEEGRRNNRGHYTTHRVLLHAPPAKFDCENLGSCVLSLLGSRDLQVQDVGATVVNPSGDLNPGTISVNGQREFANAFIVNGSDAEEDVNSGTAIVPNLDAIAAFRIITGNFDAEYGEFSGGQITVITKSGSNQFHGSLFEFFP